MPDEQDNEPIDGLGRTLALAGCTLVLVPLICLAVLAFLVLV